MPRKSYQASLAAKEERRTSRKQFILPSTLFLPQVAMQSPGISSPSPRAEAICSEQELNIFFFFPSGRYLHFGCIAFLRSELHHFWWLSACVAGPSGRFSSAVSSRAWALGACLQPQIAQTGQPAAKPQPLQTVAALHLILFRKMK